MNVNEVWMWLIVGLIPYHIIWKRVKYERTLEVRALLWSLILYQRYDGQNQWTLRIPLIERLRGRKPPQP